MAGVSCVIGEHAHMSDPNFKKESGKVQELPILKEAIHAFRKYDRGYGQIIVQCNIEDDEMGVPQYAIEKCEATAIEFKFGQSAKGTQPVVPIANYEEALKIKEEGTLVYPDPESDEIKAKHAEGCCPNFYWYGRLPMWTEEYLVPHIDNLRDIGMENVYFKIGRLRSGRHRKSSSHRIAGPGRYGNI